MGDLDKQKCGGDLDKVKPATVVAVRQAGPASYSRANGFTIDTGLSAIDGYSVVMEGYQQYHPEVTSVSGGILTIEVLAHEYQLIDEGGQSTYMIHNEADNGANLSGIIFVVIAVGTP